MHAFTCEPFHNLVQHNIVTESGVSFTARRAPGEERSEFFSSEDRWCRPVMTRTGPDGALWVVDMYRYMIEHPEWLPKEGREELLPHYRLGEERGRIYRVFPSGSERRKLKPLDKLSTPDLVAALDSSNEWQRDKAHMLLSWRADRSALPLLEKMAADRVRIRSLDCMHCAWRRRRSLFCMASLILSLACGRTPCGSPKSTALLRSLALRQSLWMTRVRRYVCSSHSPSANGKSAPQAMRWHGLRFAIARIHSSPQP